ncbi:MAG: peptidylprolyl isomerase [Paludibacteraceae bacterium]|nr:peptidylprolyl isomerase [Paludibacteraceae bacterium]
MKKILRYFILFCIAVGFFACSTISNLTKMKESKVQIETTQGVIVVKLYNETPLHRDNFVKLVKERFYDGVLFHRVIADFMIQGGDPDSKTAKPNASLGNGDVGYTIPAEFKTPAIYHKKGALAAAREGDGVNPQKASSGCQFYIVEGKTFTDAELSTMEAGKIARYGINSLNDSTFRFSAEARAVYRTRGGTPHLDGNYTVFGEVTEGIDVVEKISKVKTNASDRPVEDVRVITMKMIK